MKKQAKKTWICSFRGEFAFLSNFYPAETEYEGVVYKTSEHAFQAAKSLDIRDREYIKSAATPADAKRMGGSVQLREDWSEVKLSIMKECLLSKFNRNKALKKKLIETGDTELVEENNWNDDFWGKCTEKGQNHLGRILMEIREDFKKEQSE